MRMFLGMSPTGGRNCRYYTVGLGGGRHGKSFVRRTGNSHPEVRDIYEKTLRGKPGSVYKLLAHRPEMLKNFMAFYASVGRSLERRLYEMVYIRVSMINQCHY